MPNYIIMTDSSCDLPQALVEQWQIHVVPLTVNYRGGQFENYPDGRELDPKEFYAGVRSGEMPSTSAVNVGRWTDEIESHLKQGTDVLILGFSSGLSTTYQSAVIAAGDLAPLYPERSIAVVDTLCASMGQGLIIWLAAQRRAQGESLEAVRDFVEQEKLHVCHWFTVDDLNHLRRGGRISAATAIVGGLLNIKPILHVDVEGKLVSISKARGRKAAMEALLAQMASRITNPKEQTVFISHGDCLAEAEAFAQKCREQLGVQDVIISYIGPVIGAHAGPGTLAVFFLGTER